MRTHQSGELKTKFKVIRSPFHGFSYHFSPSSDLIWLGLSGTCGFGSVGEVATAEAAAVGDSSSAFSSLLSLKSPLFRMFCFLLSSSSQSGFLGASVLGTGTSISLLSSRLSGGLGGGCFLAAPSSLVLLLRTGEDEDLLVVASPWPEPLVRPPKTSCVRGEMHVTVIGNR